MTAKKTAIAATCISVVFVGGALWFWGHLSSGVHRGATALPRVNMIRMGTPQRRDFRLLAHWIGTVTAENVVRVQALEAGRVVAVNADDGASVTEGTPLFTLGGPRLNSRLIAARQNVAALREQAALAESSVIRKRWAVKTKVGSRDELDSARAMRERLRAEFRGAQQALARLQNGTCVRASADGVFTHRRVSIGQDVEKGTILAELVSTAHLRVTATLFPPDSISLTGKAATVRGGRDQPLAGIVRRTLAERTSTGGVVVWIEGAEIDRSLNPGETVSGDIVIEAHDGALALPRSALVRDEQERAYVFLKGPEGYRKQRVQTGLISDGWVEITSGIADRDSVVVRGAYELFYRNFGSQYKVAD